MGVHKKEVGMNISKYLESKMKLCMTGMVAGLLAFGLSACSDDSSSSASSEDDVVVSSDSKDEDKDESSSSVKDSTDEEVSSSSIVYEVKARANQLVKDMGAGINLGNVFEAPNTNFKGFDDSQFKSNWSETIKPKDFKALADSGFKNIRIPVSWEEHVTGEGAECVVDEDWMKQVFWAVDHTIKNGMIAVINTHHWDAMYENPDEETPCLLSVYKQMMANVIKYSPDSLVVETLNEPRGKLTNDKWNSVVASIINVVREADPARVIMVGTYNYNSYNSAAALSLPAGVENIIVTFHYYDPFNFTHQGADFVDPKYETGTEWRATPGQKRAVRTAFSKIKDWSDKHDIPVYLGEFGAYEAADSVSRETWTSYISYLAHSLGFATAYWEFSSGFGVYDENKDEWRSYLMRALLRPTMTFDDAVYPDLDTLGYVLLDDFDGFDGDSIHVSALAAKVAKSKGDELSDAPSWYAYCIPTSNMTIESGDTIITGIMVADTTNSYEKTNFEQMITKNGHDGRGLYVKIHLEGDSYPWAGFGTQFDSDNKKRFDFKNLKAMTFWAKGTGSFKINWKTDYADTCCADTWGAFGTEIDLTDEWKQYTVWFDQWVASAWSDLQISGAEWLDHNDDIFNLQFSNGSSYGEVVNEDLEIWLDDIRFYGMSDSDFGIKK